MEVEKLVEVFCRRLGNWTFQKMKDAQEIASKTLNSLEGRKPSSIAAAAILYVMKRDRLNGDIGKVAAVSPNTLRSAFAEMKCLLGTPGEKYFDVEGCEQLTQE